jgi:hypothetical protein
MKPVRLLCVTSVENPHTEGAMPQYQAYLVGKDGSRVGIEEITECPDDAFAIGLAKTYVDGHDVELFNGDRPVAKLRKDDPPDRESSGAVDA